MPGWVLSRKGKGITIDTIKIGNDQKEVQYNIKGQSIHNNVDSMMLIYQSTP